MSEFRYRRLDKQNAAVLLVDHQSGLISLVQNFSPGEFKNNVLALAACARYFDPEGSGACVERASTSLCGALSPCEEEQ